MANNLNIPTTEDEIRKLNPWEGPYLNPNPHKLYDEKAQWLLKCDADIMNEYNEKNKKRDCVFRLCKRPEPFCGNPLTSKVIILSLNPGFVERVDVLLARILQLSELKKDILKLVIQHKEEQLKLNANSFLCQQYKNHDGFNAQEVQCAIDGWYWYDIFEKFRKDAGLEQRNEINDVIYNNVALIQYVGYHSKSWKDLPQILPSQEFTRTLIHYLALHKKDVLFVVSRSEKLWKELIGDEVWKKLDKEKRLVHRKTFQNKKEKTQTIRTQGFGMKTFEDDGFERIANKLKS